MKNKILLPVFFVVAGCHKLDPYADKFHNIAIGAERRQAVEVMGPPHSVNSIEVPLVRVEQLAWKAVSGRVYIVHTAMDRVVSKSQIQ